MWSNAGPPSPNRSKGSRPKCTGLVDPVAVLSNWGSLESECGNAGGKDSCRVCGDCWGTWARSPGRPPEGMDGIVTAAATALDASGAVPVVSKLTDAAETWELERAGPLKA